MMLRTSRSSLRSVLTGLVATLILCAPVITLSTTVTDSNSPDNEHELLPSTRQAKPLTPQLVIQRGHAKSVQKVAFSPNGKLIATAGEDEIAILWDAASGKELRRFVGHEGWVFSVVFSLDSRFILTAGEDKTARLWDVSSGAEIRKFEGHSRQVEDAFFSPNGKWVVTVGQDNTARMWDVNTGRQLRLFRSQTNGVFARNDAWVSPDTHLIITKGHRDPYRIWDLTTGRLIRVLRPPGGELDNYDQNEKSRSPQSFTAVLTSGPTEAAFSPDGKRFLTVEDQVTLWDVATGRQVRTLGGRVQRASAVFSHKGQIVVTLDDERRVVFWDTVTGLRLRQLNTENREFDKAKFSDDDNFLLTWGLSEHKVVIWQVSTGGPIQTIDRPDRTILDASFSSIQFIQLTYQFAEPEIWDPLNGKLIYKLGGNTLAVNHGEFAAHGRFLALYQDHCLTIWDIQRGVEHIRFQGANLETASISHNGDSLLTIWKNIPKAVLYDIETHRELSRFGVGSLKTTSALISPDSKIVTTKESPINDEGSNTRDRSPQKLPASPTHFWDFVTAKELPLFEVPGQIITNVLFSSSGDLALTFNSDNSVRLWSVSSRKELKRIQGTEAVKGVSSDCRMAVYAGKNKPASLLDLISDRTLAVLNVGRITSAKFSPDGGRLLIICENETTARLYDTMSGREIGRIRFGNPDFDFMNGVADVFATFSPDGRRIVTGGNGTLLGFSTQSTAFLWETQDTKIQSRELRGHANRISSGSFTPDGKAVLTTSDDGTARLWNANSGEEICTLFSLADQTWIVVTPDGRFDTNNLERIRGLHWVMPDDPLRALRLEIFMRDYYEPRLLPRTLKGEKFCELPSLAELNRVQPKIGKIAVVPRDHPGVVDVKVEVSSDTGQCVKDGKHVPCESGVYDLRLYRDRQLVGQSPGPSGNVETSSCPGSARGEQIRKWRESSVVRTKTGQLVTAAIGKQEVTFTGVRLPQRSGISKVEFTAYAFNEDRVKSETSEPAVYVLPQSRSGVRRRAYVIAMGVDATSDPSLRLGFAPGGAREVQQLLNEKLRSQYEVISIPLISEYKKDGSELAQDLATKGNLQTVLSILSGRDVTLTQRQSVSNEQQLTAATPDDLVVLYIASHGYADPAGKFYVVPSDIGEPAGISEQLLDRCLRNAEQSPSCQLARELLRHSISSDELTQWLQTIDAGQMVLVLDSCHSGAVSGPGFKPGPMGDRGFGQLSYDKGMLVLAATQAENVDWGTLELGERSLLTYALTHQQLTEPFNLREWLSSAEKQVPALYKRLVKREGQSLSSQSTLDQEPVLFDFSKHRDRLLSK